MPRSPVRSVARSSALVLLALVIVSTGGARAQGARPFTVIADKFTFQVVGEQRAEIHVQLGDLVRVTFDARDIPHSFTTEETSPHYRIDRRAEPGKPVTFDFKADQAGRTKIICKLTVESRCREMFAYLVVEAK